MKLIRKFAGYTVGAFVMLSSLMPTLAMASPLSTHTFRSISIMDAPMTAGQLGLLGNSMHSYLIDSSQTNNFMKSMKTNVSSSVVDLGHITLNGSHEISIEGKVESQNGTAIPFSLSGTLYKDPVAGVIDGSLRDKFGNFNVMRFQIVSNPSKGIFYSASAKLSHHAYLALYLEQKGTRNMVFLEAPAAKVFGEATWHRIKEFSKTFSNAPKSDVFWIERMFIPDKFVHRTSANPIIPIGNKIHSTVPTVPSPDTNLRPQTVGYPVYHFPFFQATYDIFGYSVTDSMELEEKVSYPTNTNDGTITGRLSVIYTRYDESNGTDLDESAFEIGADGVDGIKLTVPDHYPQRIQWESVAGQLERQGTWTVNASYSVTWAGASLTLAYRPTSEVTLNAGTEDCNGAYVADYYTNSGEYLNYEGNPYTNAGQDYLSVDWQAPRYLQYGGPTNVTDNVDFIYNVYNAYQNGGTDYGTYSNLLSFKTYAG